MKKILESELYFFQLRKFFIEENSEVNEAKMMHAPAIGFGKKVFSFYFKEAMIFKLGKDFNPEKEGITNWEHLNPFKNKPPMKAWFVIPYEGGKQYWEDLILKSFEFIKTQ